MTRWRVDFRVKSDMVLRKDESDIVFTAPDGSHEIHLFTRRGEGKHAADELYLSAHVILSDDDPLQAADSASDLLRAFLDVLSLATSGYYRVEARILVADWTPGLRERRFMYFKKFPNPDLPVFVLAQKHLAAVETMMSNKISGAVKLAIHWWARGVSVNPSADQFQFFWYALEILAEFSKPTASVPDKCPTCQGDLFCRTCNTVPVHRPYPKQAVRDLVLKHVKGDAEKAFGIWDKARNALLHGTEPKEIAKALGIPWERLSDSLGKAVWAALLSHVMTLTAAQAGAPGELVLAAASTYAHYEMTITSDMSMGAAHADPQNPKIDEFHPDFKLDMIVKERDEVEGDQPERGPSE